VDDDRHLFSRGFLGQPAPVPKMSPLPWTLKEHFNHGPGGHVDRVWVVLDADSKAVAEVDRWQDADLIVRSVGTRVEPGTIEELVSTANQAIARGIAPHLVLAALETHLVRKLS
jgi:hypothetical protein